MPMVVIIDSNNKLFVSDCNNHRSMKMVVGKLTMDGKVLGSHSFESPRGLALDPQGNIHVAACSSNMCLPEKVSMSGCMVILLVPVE